MRRPLETTVLALALAAAGLAAAPAAQSAPRQVQFGFHGVTYDREAHWAGPGFRGQLWELMAANGVESARVIFDWSAAQDTPGTPPSFHETDPIVEQAAARGIELLPVVIYAPPWARVIPDRKESAPSDMGAYGSYLRALVARYGPDGSFWDEHPSLTRRPLRWWQLWNEPDMAYQWLPREGWQQAYGTLLRTGRAALRQADPGARVVLASLTNRSWETLAGLYAQAKIRKRIDAVALNVYTREPKSLVKIVKRGRKVMRGHGHAKLPIRITELGASASAGRIVAEGQEHLQVTDSELAALVTRIYETLAAQRKTLGIQRAYWYSFASSYDERSGGVFDFSGLVQYVEERSVEPRPALGAYRAIAHLQQGR